MDSYVRQKAHQRSFSKWAHRAAPTPQSVRFDTQSFSAALRSPTNQGRAESGGLGSGRAALGELALCVPASAVLTGALAGHLMNLPFASRQGAARLGAEPAIRPTAVSAIMIFRISLSLSTQPLGHTAMARASTLMMDGMAESAVPALRRNSAGVVILTPAVGVCCSCRSWFECRCNSRIIG